MAKTATKPNKKDEQKKMMVRIVCAVLVVALAVTSLLAAFPTLFQSEEQKQIQAMLDAGMIYITPDGSYAYTEEYLQWIAALQEPLEDGHDHDHDEDLSQEQE